jgi:hypothetical protein
MARKLSLAQALRHEMIARKARYAWAGDPDLLLEAYDKAGGAIQHPLDRIQAVLAAARRSLLFVQGATSERVTTPDDAKSVGRHFGSPMRRTLKPCRRSGLAD